MDNRHKAVWDWMYQCQDIPRLFFNFGKSENGNTVVDTIASEKVIKKYVGGSSMRAYDFAVIQYKPANVETPNNPENAAVIFDVEAVMRWVETQNKQRNFPVFPDNCTIQRIENLANMPTVAGQDELGAKYMFAVRITYLQGA